MKKLGLWISASAFIVTAFYQILIITGAVESQYVSFVVAQKWLKTTATSALVIALIAAIIAFFLLVKVFDSRIWIFLLFIFGTTLMILITIGWFKGQVVAGKSAIIMIVNTILVACAFIGPTLALIEKK